MKSISGVLYWPTTYINTQSELNNIKQLDEDLDCDFVIVGSGESGSLCSYFLSQTGAKVILLDKRKVAHGSTSANTGLLQYTNDKSLNSFIHSYGKEKAVRHYQLCVEAIKGIEEMSKTIEINPDFIKRSSLYYASDLDGKKMIDLEYKVLKENGFNVEYFTKAQVKEKFNFTKEGALFTGDDAEVNPYKCAHGLLLYALKRGLKAYSDTEVTSIIGTKEGVQLFTKNKHTIRAKKVIFAGGYESLEVKSEKNAVLTSTFAIATQPLIENKEAWYENCLIWETARPYLYIRTTVEGRIIVGGLDEPTIIPEKRESMLFDKKEQLIKNLIELFPQYKEAKAEFYWTGAFGGTHTGLPMIKQYNEYPNCLFLMAYGGNGTVYSYILAKILKDLVAIGTHPDAHLYMNN
ncbi:FAD-binding oxidoreductase [Bacillus sp. AFS041924]|uniref:NAD(P)/FAD-dependent oxidoreductase n=1 Tax=Bacillus sp. AFS041924 TaxID=2033503 RepID=UPI000BFC0E59|nr:FAD-dependent oxidoreductase [Bacillus sp. AFS041924]PGS54602.1 FAD-dependent oxidoreductase [Bacillus sp. AFS041924]